MIDINYAAQAQGRDHLDLAQQRENYNLSAGQAQQRGIPPLTGAEQKEQSAKYLAYARAEREALDLQRDREARAAALQAAIQICAGKIRARRTDHQEVLRAARDIMMFIDKGYVEDISKFTRLKRRVT